MTGFQLTARVNRSAELVPRPCGPPSRWNSSRLLSWRWRTSAPLQNARPLPLMIALSLSGRFSVIVAILSAQEYSTKFCSSVSTIPSREVPADGQLAGRGGGCQRQPRGSLRLRQPAPIARRGTPRQALRQARPGLVVVPGAQGGGDEGVLENLALGVAAADPRQFGERGAQFVGGQRVVAAGKCCRAGAQTRHDRALRRLPAPGELVGVRNALPGARVVARRGLGEDCVDIGEMHPRVRKKPLDMGGHLFPLAAERRALAIELP